MKPGDVVLTDASVRPPRYANREGTVTIADSDGEVQVKIGGGLVWFRPEELAATGERRKVIERPGAGQEWTGMGGRHSDSHGTGNGPPAPVQEASGITDGSRGPGGGLYAKCEECGGVWEREKRRGRPVKICLDCAR